MKFAIVKIAPQNYIHAHAFNEVAEAIHYAILELGHESKIFHNHFIHGAINIVIGANTAAEQLLQHKLPEDTILFNFEQIFADSPWLSSAYMTLLKQYPVWDYSRLNIDRLMNFGVENITHMPVGYVTQLSKIPAQRKNIDVLFYGSMNERRVAIINALEREAVDVRTVFGVYGEQRDELIARAKIVLNMHFYESKIFEIVRVSYLLANRQFVISERSSDIEEEQAFAPGLVICDYEELCANCIKYLRECPEERDKIAQRGYELVSQRLQKDFLAPVIAQLTKTKCHT